jgi:dTDP-4-dehydrorhamnose reductase
VLAVTAWSLLGSFDWNSLVTQKNDQYEPGIYDVRSTPPRSTALAKLIYDLATTKQISIPVLEVPGWWRRPRRFEYGFSIDNMGTCGAARSESINSDYPNARPILITDANSSLGRSFVHLCELRGIPYRTLERQLPETDEPLPWQLPFHELNPWAVIDAGAFTRVSSEKSRSGRDFRESQSRAPQLLQECKERGVRFLSFSSDLVFDGNKGAPYIESDVVGPLNDRGCSQAESEKLVQSVIPEALIVRSGPLLGPFDRTNFVVRALRCLAWKLPFAAANDVVLSPTYIPDLVDACLDLLIDGESGIWHLSNVGQVSWASLAAMAARLAKISFATFRSCTRKELGFGINLPKYSALTSERAILLPTLEESLGRYTRECATLWHSQLNSETLAA